MARIDYMKVIDVIAKTFGADKEFELKASHDKVDIFDVILKDIRGSSRDIKLLMDSQSLTIRFSRTSMDEKEFRKWVSIFEYELEQTFLINIKMTLEHESSTYVIKIHL